MFLPSFGSFSQAVPEEKMLRNRPTRNTNCLCRICSLADRNTISSRNRVLPIDASCISLLYWASGFTGEDLFLKIDKPERRIGYDGLVC